MADDAAFDEVYARCVTRLVRQVYAVTTDLGDAEDIVQEAFARAYLRWSRIRSYDDPEAWVRSVAFRLAVSRWRRLRKVVISVPAVEAPELTPDRVALVDALRRLPLAQRQSIVLHHYVGLPVANVAEELGVPVGTVKARLSRGRTALAALLDEGHA